MNTIKKYFVLVLLLLVSGGMADAEDIIFGFEGALAGSAKVGPKIELIPVLQLIGAEASFSLAAGTFGITFEDHNIQFTPGRRSVLVDGVLKESSETPIASPGGVAASLPFLEREILSPLGFHLEPSGSGYNIVPGARFADPVMVRAVAADFSATTTVVLTFGRKTEAEVTHSANGDVLVYFPDASPHVDPSMSIRSRRIQMVVPQAQTLLVKLDKGVGLTSWHALDGPPRVILELGQVRPTPTPAPLRPVESLHGPSVVIDPGHGGDDIGAESPDGIKEKDIVLSIALKLRKYLESRGVTVRLTRQGDEQRALTDRTALANRLEAKVFVSLHANSSTVASVRGGETYYMSLDQSATDDVAKATADLENQADNNPPERSALDMILWDLAQSEVLNESAQLALRVQGHLNAHLALRDRGVKQAPFVVLTGATMPAVLVEVGFLSNPAEARRLADPLHQQGIAEAIGLGILDYILR